MYYMEILLGCCKTKIGRGDKFNPTAGKVRIDFIHQTLEEK
jgi:hypothetical protein